jgi:RNA polymerase sigma-70 factor (ECF subfamily)
MTRVVEAGPDEWTLLDLAAQGNEAAFEQIVATHHAEMQRISFLIVGDPDLAQDAVQQAWQMAWRKLTSVRDPARLRSWLIAIAANEARQLIRRRRRRSELEPQMDPPVWSGSDPGSALANLDLVEALHRLKVEDRVLLALRYVAGFDSTEIARMIGGSASGVRTRLARLLDRLREELTDA